MRVKWELPLGLGHVDRLSLLRLPVDLGPEGWRGRAVSGEVADASVVNGRLVVEADVNDVAVLLAMEVDDGIGACNGLSDAQVSLALERARELVQVLKDEAANRLYRRSVLPREAVTHG